MVDMGCVHKPDVLGCVIEWCCDCKVWLNMPDWMSTSYRSEDRVHLNR